MSKNISAHKIRSLIGTIITLLVLVGAIMFAWRVVHYANLINSGELESTNLSFLNEFSVGNALLETPIPDGAFDLVTEDDPSLGSSDAVVTIVEFADFGCSFSQKSSFVIRALARNYGDQIHYVYRDFPLDELHPDARLAAQAGHCANEQDKFWEYHDKLYLNQSDLSESALVNYAEQINLNVSRFTHCLDSGVYAKEVEQDYQDGFEAGVRGTPTFFINGNRIPGSIPEDIFNALIQNFLGN